MAKPTVKQMEDDIRFLAERAKRAGSWSSDAKRDWGVSSNSIVSFAYGVGTPQMPSDWSDYIACVRAVRNMPRHRRTQMVMTALSIQKSVVEKKYPPAARRQKARKFPEPAL